MDDDKGLGFRFLYSTRKNPYSRKATLLHSAGLGIETAIEQAWEIVEELPVVHLWYKLIAEANGLEPNDPKVAEAYWVGSELLDHLFDYETLHQTIQDRFPHIVIGKPTGTVPPHHNLHVTHYGIVSQPDAPDEERTDCLVIPAKSLDGVTLFESLLDERPLEVTNSFGYLIDNGSPVAIHRNIVCTQLTKSQRQNLEIYGSELQ